MSRVPRTHRRLRRGSSGCALACRLPLAATVLLLLGTAFHHAAARSTKGATARRSRDAPPAHGVPAITSGGHLWGGIREQAPGGARHSGTAVVGPRRAAARCLLDRARGQHRQRPHPDDRAGPGHRPDLRAVGHLDLLARIRGTAHHLRRARGSHRPQADVHDRHGDLHCVQCSRGGGPERRHAHPRPRRRSRGRSDDAAHLDGHHQRQLPRAHARSCLRPVGSGLRRHGRLRSSAWRLACRRCVVALGVLHQRAARSHQPRHGVVHHC